MTLQEIMRHAERGLQFLQFAHGPGVPVVQHSLESIYKLAALAEKERIQGEGGNPPQDQQ